MKRILFVNGGSKEFGNRFRNACEQAQIECVSVRSHHNSFIIASKTGCRYFHLGEEIDLGSFDYSFIRVRGKFSHMTALMSYILSFNKVAFNDLSNLEHTMNDEKITQMVKFGCHKIPIPETAIFSKISYKKNKDDILKFVDFPCVLKTNGSKGEAVWKVNNLQEFESRIMQIEDDLIISQEYIKNDYDIRALFFESELLGAISRYSGDGFYNNVSRGGKVEEVKLSETEIELSKKAINVLGLDFGGVDFIRTEEGIIFLEINKGPMVYGLEMATGLDIPAEILKRIKKRHF